MRRRAKSGGASTEDSLDSNLLEHPGFIIRRVHQISVSAFLEAFDGLDMTPAQNAALAGIACRPGIDQASLAGLIALDRSTTGIVIARLVARKLVRREQSDKDKRFMRLKLTEAGAKLFASFPARADAAHELMLRPLTPRERNTLIRLMKRLVKHNNVMSRAPLQLPSDDRKRVA